jgi:DNA-binding transcriptional LysR family regulator
MKGSPMHLTDLQYFQAIARCGNITRAAQLLPAQQLPCSDLELAKSLALAGLGVTILPRRVAASDQQRRLVRLHPALRFIHDVVYLAYRADVHRTHAAMRLKDALVEHGRRLGRDGESQRIQQEVEGIRAPRQSL